MPDEFSFFSDISAQLKSLSLFELDRLLHLHSGILYAGDAQKGDTVLHRVMQGRCINVAALVMEHLVRIDHLAKTLLRPSAPLFLDPMQANELSPKLIIACLKRQTVNAHKAAALFLQRYPVNVVAIVSHNRSIMQCAFKYGAEELGSQMVNALEHIPRYKDPCKFTVLDYAMMWGMQEGVVLRLYQTIGDCRVSRVLWMAQSWQLQGDYDQAGIQISLDRGYYPSLALTHVTKSALQFLKSSAFLKMRHHYPELDQIDWSEAESAILIMRSNQNNPQQLFHYIVNGMPVLLYVNWKRHMTCVLLSQNKVMKCNRGVYSAGFSGVEIFKITSSEPSDFLRVIQGLLEGRKEIYLIVMHYLLGLIPVDYIPQKPHAEKTCVRKSFEAGMLALFFFFTSKTFPTDEWLSQSMALALYKRWKKFDKRCQIQDFFPFIDRATLPVWSQAVIKKK